MNSINILDIMSLYLWKMKNKMKIMRVLKVGIKIIKKYK